MSQLSFIQKSIGEWSIHIGDGNYSSKYPKASEFLSSGVPFISASDFLDGRITPKNFRFISEEQHSTLRKGQLKSCDVLIVTRGNGVGKVAWVDNQFENCNINAQLALLRADEKEIHSRYLYYILSSPEYFDLLKQYASGSAQPQLTIGSIQRVPLSLPPYERQVEIAKILNILDDKIELNRKMNETLEAMARAIFKSWFIDFDPVHAKAAGKKPFGMDAATATLFPDSFEQSKLGEIPRDWKSGILSDIFDANINTLSKNDPLKTVDYIEISGVGSGQVNEIVRYSRGSEPSRARRKIAHFDTILSTVRPDRRSFFLAWNPPETHIVSTGFVVLTPKDKKSGTFGFLHVTQQDFTDELGRLADGGAYPAISPDVILSRKCIVPVGEVVNAFDAVVSPLLELIHSNNAESVTLANTRDLLLPRLLSGEVELKEAV
jgi:type I restriction enzyme S subunit